ncbi:MAG: adenylate/guanylate cyclase domain-containing protein [Trichodesmium sp. St16_bin4-tuft]|nr:adenylate/guanylate cyclase domain-containing protein [Trichodesmium sp. MAG_R01]MDE5067986.1 adenylate/guanylate cyclase domain-containing protein [Trichodesmium sp. St4_bin8_1]MDE5070699.1 adenylate/guanylate cyclase domain-containing protein [Trichodesmium sp. St5_bin8]MDE5078927.1 adenylate/guanylate cyclase domain-containing protein [Trichodesmium sp. St2_bin6]MDE5100140.1 adenylate/guanylate cyclase domain-containing protein [Trichodesmium sp. St16_bin4-tuft]MDE5104131.1 adenylate/gua
MFRSKFLRFFYQWYGVWITAPSITGLIILLRFFGLLQFWEWSAYDGYMRMRPLESRDNRIAIVGINEDDLRTIGQPIFPDAVYADLLNKLKAMKPKVIGLDIYRDLPVEPGHQKLVEVFKSTPNIVGIKKVVGERQADVTEAPPVLEENKRAGANDLKVDSDQKIRRGYLFMTLQNRQNIPSFASHIALRYLKSFDISPEPIEGDKYQLGKAVLEPFEADDGGYVRADAGGYLIILNYRGPSRSFETVSMMDILKDRVPLDWGRDRIILIGTVGQSFNDLHSTPYSSSLIRNLEPMSGVEVHANLISQLISSAIDGRSMIKIWGDTYEWIWILFWSGVGSATTWKWRTGVSVSYFSIWKVITIFVAGGVLFASTYIAFLWNWWLPVVPAFLGMITSAIVITAYIARTAQNIRKTFGRYLTDEVVATLLESPQGLKLGGERRKITILTSDLRGFTATSERLPPEEVVKILNFYLGYMADVITEYQGTIDEFMGDGILVLFGAPTYRGDDPTRAVACAIAMQLAMEPVNKQMKEWGLTPLEMGIGINTGEVVVGNIGSWKRTKYGIVGNQVNLTYRIESYTTGGQILISETTLNEVGSIIKINGKKEVMPKGVKKPITIYDLGGIGGKYNLFLPKEEEIYLPLKEAISLHYVVLDGKNVSACGQSGSLVKLSKKEAEIQVVNSGENIPHALINIKINFFWDGKESEDVYGKVLDKKAENGNFYIHFTAKPPDVSAKLESLYKSLQT